jgi:hypothetical protein
MSLLIRPTETPEQALRRLERSPDCRWVETDAGQALLRECAQRAAKARREAVPA